MNGCIDGSIDKLGCSDGIELGEVLRDGSEDGMTDGFSEGCTEGVCDGLGLVVGLWTM